MTSDFWDDLPQGELYEHARISEQIANILRRAISRGNAKAGTKIPEVKVANALKVSRHSLRNAFLILADDGLVERHPNRGVFVRRPTPDDIREVYRVRRVLEPGALRNCKVSQATAEALGAIVDSARTADLESMANANQQFHRLLVAQAQSELLDGLMYRVLAWMRLAFSNHDLPFYKEYLDRNEEIVRLLLRGEQGKAELALVDYLDTSERDVLNHMQQEKHRSRVI